VEKGNQTVFSDKSLKLLLHRGKQVSKATLQGCCAPAKLGRQLRVTFQFRKCWGMTAEATSNAAVRGVVANDEVFVGYVLCYMCMCVQGYVYPIHTTSV
jgi:hypothetical protein